MSSSKQQRTPRRGQLKYQPIVRKNIVITEQEFQMMEKRKCNPSTIEQHKEPLSSSPNVVYSKTNKKKLESDHDELRKKRRQFKVKAQ